MISFDIYRVKYKVLMKYFGLFCAIFLLAACSDSSDEVIVDMKDTVLLEKDAGPLPAARQTGTYFFGFDLRSSPQEDARQYLPFLNYLQQETGYTFELKFTAKGQTITDNLAQGVTHFAAIGAGSYIAADEKNRPVSLVRGKNNQGRAEYRSFIVVSKESGINNLADLKGKIFAFGGKSSTQGYIIPRIILSKSGIKLGDFKDYIYTGSHYNCVNAVISKKADACGMQDIMAESMAAQNLVRILYKSEYYPSSGIVASQSVPAEVCKKVKQALLNFDPEGKHKALLYHWDNTEMPKGFVSSSDADYKNLREWANKLGLLEG